MKPRTSLRSWLGRSTPNRDARSRHGRLTFSATLIDEHETFRLTIFQRAQCRRVSLRPASESPRLTSHREFATTSLGMQAENSLQELGSSRAHDTEQAKYLAATNGE